MSKNPPARPYERSNALPAQDRNSIGLANVMGLSKDLHLTPNQYYNCLTMFCECFAAKAVFKSR